MGMKSYREFENCVAKIFKQNGFSVEQNVSLGKNPSSGDIDIIAKKESKVYCVEVKYRFVRRSSVERVCQIAESRGMIPVVVAACILEDREQTYYRNIFQKLILVDIANLLFAVESNAELKNELISGLPYAVDGITPRKGFLKNDYLVHENLTLSLIKEMEQCEAGKSQFSTYEELCQKLLKNAFAEDLTLWRTQQKSNNELYRFDLLCRIKDGNQKTFWNIVEKYFNSKYIVFEFKNYTSPITQKEIYTTEKYLYAKALRKVGIIIAKNGFDNNAYWAVKGCLRESGKLILLLKGDDLIKMNRIKMEQEDPSDYLLEKLDNLLLELEK